MSLSPKLCQSHKFAKKGIYASETGVGACNACPGLLQSRISPLSHQRSECFVEMIGECASGMSDIGLPLSGEQSKDRVVEHCKHLGGMAHAHLSMIFSQRGIASIMEAIFNSPMPSGQVQYAF